MLVLLYNFGLGPSLSLQNLKFFALADKNISSETEIDIQEIPLQRILDKRRQALMSWQFSTELDAILTDIQRRRPRLIGFTCYLWNISEILQASELIKRVYPQTLVLLGGPEVSPRAESILAENPTVDFVVRGDGEIPFRELLRRLLSDDGPSFEGVPGLFYRDRNGDVHQNAEEAFTDLEDLRGVTEGLSDPKTLGLMWDYILYETSRGCPFRCSYCTYGNRKVSSKPESQIIDEIGSLLDRGLKVEVTDPNFTAKPKRAKAILRGLRGRKDKLQLYFEAHPDRIDEELAELFVEAGTRMIGLGLQTISEVGQRLIRRNQDLDAFTGCLQILKNKNVPFYVDVMYGIPGTTLDDFLATLRFLEDHGVCNITIYRLLGLPGSPLVNEDLDEHGLVFNPYPPYELLRSNTMSTEDLMFCDAISRQHKNVL